MTENFKTLLKLFGMGVRGDKLPAGENIDVKAVMQLAENQGVKQIVYSALSENYDVSAYELSAISTIAQNIRKISFIHSIVQKLESAGIECCYLKGVTVSRFYAEPDARISGDTDIYVDKKDVKKVRQILAENGFELESFTDTMYHFEAHHPIGGLLEVHYSFCRDKVKDLIFEDRLTFDEEHISLDIGGMQVKSLSVNDSLNYLTAHMVKHFITDGIALRQIMDLLLYMEHYEKELDMEAYRALWKELGFLEFIDTLCGIGVKYWRFSLKNYSEDGVEALLADIENGGLFGFNERQRKDFLDVFFAQKYSGESETVKKYMNKNPVKRVWGLLFPSKTYMKKKGYAGVERGGLHLPLAYVKRIWDLAISVVRGEKSIRASVDYKVRQADNPLQTKRIELMKELGMLNK